MMSSWWLIWMIFMFLFLIPPLGYGWGYRGWGPPYPRYVQRRRSEHLAASGALRPVQTRILGVGWRRRLDAVLRRPPLGGHGALLVAALVSMSELAAAARGGPVRRTRPLSTTTTAVRKDE